jgi:hypothetical protein
LDDDPVVTGENASDLALVPLCQKFDAHSGIITNGLLGSGYAGLGNTFRRSRRAKLGRTARRFKSRHRSVSGKPRGNYQRRRHLARRSAAVGKSERRR